MHLYIKASEARRFANEFADLANLQLPCLEPFFVKIRKLLPCLHKSSSPLIPFSRNERSPFLEKRKPRVLAPFSSFAVLAKPEKGGGMRIIKGGSLG
jgi:hypothetical protein